MAFTDERLHEICQRYALVEPELNDDGEATGEQIATLDKTTMKMYTAERSTDVSALKKSRITNSEDVGYWSTVINGKWELVFDTDPNLIDADGIFTEIQE